MKFFDNNITSKYLKNKINNTNIPNIRYVCDGQYITKDICYVHRGNIIRCTKSGYINKISETYKIPLTNKNLASYTLIGNYYFDMESPTLTNRHKFNTDDYNLHIHEMLGEYLRCLRGYYGLDLMSLYNCAMPSFIDDLTVDYELVGRDDYTIRCSESIICGSHKVGEGWFQSLKTTLHFIPNSFKNFIIPIKFNTPYTIRLNDPSQAMIVPILIDKNNLDDKSFIVSLNSTLSYSNSGILTTGPTNNETFNIFVRSECENDNLEKYERYLYLFVQTATGEKSNLTVLEGNYDINQENKISLLVDDLMYMKPFADKLIEYLCENTIDNREIFGENINNIGNKVYQITGDKSFVNDYEWSNQLQNTLKTIYISSYLNNKNNYFDYVKDILGYVDSDIEHMLYTFNYKK